MSDDDVDWDAEFEDYHKGAGGGRIDGEVVIARSASHKSNISQTQSQLSDMKHGEFDDDDSHLPPVDMSQFAQDEFDSDQEGEANEKLWIGANDKDDNIINNNNRVARRASLVRVPRLSAYDSVSHALSNLKSFQAQITDLLNSSMDFSDDIQDHLFEIKRRLEIVTENLDDISQQDNRNDVDALLDWDKLWWNFNNNQVINFRARAARVQHNMLKFNNWHMPQFYSKYPLPQIGHTLMVTVTLPNHSGMSLQETKVVLKSDDTVAQFLGRAVDVYKKKLHGAQLEDETNVETFVLKAKGFMEYFDPRSGNKLVFDHEYVRRCLRNRISLEMALVKRPMPLKINPEHEEAAKTYQTKVISDTKVLSLHEHQDLAVTYVKMSWLQRQTLPYIPMSVIGLPFKVEIIGVDNLDGGDKGRLPRLQPGINSVYVQTFLFHGTTILDNGVGEVPSVPISTNPRWRFWTSGSVNNIPIPINNIPRETRIAFLLYGNKSKDVTDTTKRRRDQAEIEREQKENHVLLAYVVQQLVDIQGFLASGTKTLSMWPVDKPKNSEMKKIMEKREQGYDFIFRATTRENGTTPYATRIQVKFLEFARPIVSPIVERYEEPNQRMLPSAVDSNVTDKQINKALERLGLEPKRLMKLAQADLFEELTEQDKHLLWAARNHLIKNPGYLPDFLMCVDWTKREQRMEVYRLLKIWKKLPGMHYLELLGASYADYRVREYAVECLNEIPDDELSLYLLQLTQCLKVEPYHDSPLARFLITRALKNPYQFGHQFFWSLKAELNQWNPEFCERYGVILEEYLSHAGPFTAELRKENNTVLRLEHVAEHIANLKNNLKTSKANCKKEYEAQLKRLNLAYFSKMGSFHVPLDSKLQAKNLIIDKCRFMSSKKVPLLLWFSNADESASPLSVIFKSGDDLRQDILTIQILRVMDKIWLSQDPPLDLCMTPYTCIATGLNKDGEGVGMIETVTESETVADIQWMYGGEQASAAFDNEVIDRYLRENNKGDNYDEAVNKFMHSLAGYCVATYLLGIGDRHNDNYMVKKDGVFFHIDFGHFLGNWKYKMGICRERTKFVFTPEMCFVLGGPKSKKYAEFKELCYRALLAARHHGRLLENLFNLMVSAGMPELVIKEDIKYLSDRLMLGEKDNVAKKAFAKELKASLNDRVRRIDNQFHLVKHKGK